MTNLIRLTVANGYSSPMLRNYTVVQESSNTFRLEDDSGNAVRDFTNVEEIDFRRGRSVDFNAYKMKIRQTDDDNSPENTVFLFKDVRVPPAAIAVVYHPNRGVQGIWSSSGSQGSPDDCPAMPQGSFWLTLRSGNVFNSDYYLTRNSDGAQLFTCDGSLAYTISGVYSFRDNIEYLLGSVRDSGLTYAVIVFFDSTRQRIFGVISNADSGGAPNTAVFGGESDGTFGG